jgi:hypothetical protein
MGGHLTATICCEIGAHDHAAAINAARWISQFYSDVTATVGNRRVDLASGVRGPAELKRVWQTCLANEKLIIGGDAMRASLLAELIE